MEGWLMEKDTEEQILDELKNMNRSLQSINTKLEESKENPNQTFFGPLKSLLFGLFIVGPAIAVVWGILLLLDGWVLN
jgi:hypothetical protein